MSNENANQPSNTYIFKDGYITQKPEMVEPHFFEGTDEAYRQWHQEYSKHLVSLPSYAYPIKLENGTELVEGKDFVLQPFNKVDKTGHWTYKAIPLTPSQLSKEDDK